MKYYNQNGMLIVHLSDGLAIRCTLKEVRIKKRFYQKLEADFTVVSRVFKDIPIHTIPISEKQAVCLFNKMRQKERLYGYSCEIWEAIRRKKKGQISETDIMSSVLISMVERELDLKPPKMEVPYFWRKALMAHEN
jgi:hypothetical protein